MADHPIQGLMKTAMENLKEMIDVNTIIGDPVETPDGSVILTVSKVGFGFAAGGSEFGSKPTEKKSEDNERKEQKLPFGGGSGGGVSITPIAFLIVGTTGVRMLHLDENTHLIDKLLDSAPQTIERIQQMFKKNDKGQNKKMNDIGL
ncbi:GerW family sporulation protein [Bacillus atrophaeus]|uniref:GerW family sporulation protein n=1 Tax=Bacillus atrophaeus TaxID=1452 RepID=UPI00032E1E91|nr:GerW family sporulation protein [Bacillus atrophaeus]AKL85778.1 YtfJ [Bacillus atrophaeus UCMB-5137]MBU5262637.1 GerW family sporulation protein [Bacillus atrophaeus]MCY7947071.1 GerW family sporulation protein [Bacillus atrophaeus]MCY8096691.1 GerW family sporulation protein [Bacillus atrophaeus]MCY8504414.1 GerW family sporulation protein [Bacillus atrophaeus]